jgi:hypothetical protein
MPSDEKDREGSILGTESGQEQPSPPPGSHWARWTHESEAIPVQFAA